MFNLALEQSFPEVMFSAEISQVTCAASGHIYLRLKDDQSQLKAVIWKGLAGALTFRPEAGLEVICHGKPNVYKVTGELQVVVHRMVQAGAGALQKKFLELKAKLEKEGLFSLDRKRSLPFFPTSIGVVTSKTGAVIHDIMVKIRERMPSTKVYLVDVRVQGVGAAEEIAQGVRLLNESGLVEVIIVGRGGGSLEDLWAFNEEVVCRAIFASQVPVVSGVGHEVDLSLSDLVADVRAPTPTAAAEMVVPKRTDLLTKVSQLERRLVDSDCWFQPLVQQLDDLVLRFGRRIVTVIDESKMHLSRAEARLQLIEPTKFIAMLRGRLLLLGERLFGIGSGDIKSGHNALERVEQRVKVAYDTRLAKLSHELERLSTQLVAVSPKRVMERGYSVVESNGRVVRSYLDLDCGDQIKVRLFEGGIVGQVKDTFKEI